MLLKDSLSILETINKPYHDVHHIFGADRNGQLVVVRHYDLLEVIVRRS